MRSAIENQMQHQVVFSYIFVQLLYIDSIHVLGHTEDGYTSDRNMFVMMMMIIIIITIIKGDTRNNRGDWYYFKVI